MRYRPLPRTQLNLSEIGFGVWTVSSSDWGITDRREGERLLKQAFDLGVTFFDTSDVTGDGEEERVLGSALRSSRHDIVIATKGGYDWYTPGHLRPAQRTLAQNWTPSYIRKACESSLIRLNTDYIDLYQLHHASMSTLHDGQLPELLEMLKKEGKIRYWGMVLGPADELVGEEGFVPTDNHIDALSMPYSLMEHELPRRIPAMFKDPKIGILARDVHAGGLFGGSARDPAPAWIDGGSDVERTTASAARLEALQNIADTHGITVAQAALQFVLIDQHVVSTLPNVATEQQLTEFASVSELAPSTTHDLETMAEL